MKPEELTEEHLRKVFEIYQQHLGGDSTFVGYSRVLENLRPKFNDNLPRDHPFLENAVAAGKRFEVAALEYLCSQEQKEKGKK